jgi:hypothetical protein
MDISKVRAAIKAAQDAVQVAITTTATNAVKAPNDIKGLPSLVKAGEALAKADERLDEAVEKTTPKVKEEKTKDDKGKK